ncbi:uncharacterized protein LOC112269740 [Brachypodium distachyon]|uniref:uncharacterized protein LOC112269740 n=1 Tax=Brachypodium distachyon TaxID=15368 RepID=UPI000D0CB917|nr:uncharacterized protein LOC112269740 [Brachypodium distachyon]|eukprot:XP_024312528.1 uncharacterized protein LOC112269740 [Brachypodium distachyon]
MQRLCSSSRRRHRLLSPPSVEMEKEKQAQGDKKEKKPRAHWTCSQLEFLVYMMKEYADTAKYYGQNGFTKEAWNHMSSRLNTQFPKADFTIVQIKDREQRLKKDYSIVKSILNKSGFGWDPVQKVPESIDEKWDELSKEQRKWRYKAFPHYDDLHGIYDGKTAEGKRCKRTTDMFEEKDSSPAFVPEETCTESVLRAAGLNSPTPTIPGPDLDGHQYDWDRGLYGDDVEFPSAARSQGVENPSSQFEAE